MSPLSSLAGYLVWLWEYSSSRFCDSPVLSPKITVSVTVLEMWSYKLPWRKGRTKTERKEGNGSPLPRQHSLGKMAAYSQKQLKFLKDVGKPCVFLPVSWRNRVMSPLSSLFHHQRVMGKHGKVLGLRFLPSVELYPPNRTPPSFLSPKLTWLYFISNSILDNFNFLSLPVWFWFYISLLLVFLFLFK